MAHNPTTFAGESGNDGRIDWDEVATLHHRPVGEEGAGVLHDMTAARRSSLADLVRYVALLPEEARREYSIERPGDREYQHYEIVKLYDRPDFPHAS